MSTHFLKKFFSSSVHVKRDFLTKPLILKRWSRGDDGDEDGAVLLINTQSPAPSQPSPAPSSDQQQSFKQKPQNFPPVSVSPSIFMLLLSHFFLPSFLPPLHSDTLFYSVQQRERHTNTKEYQQSAANNDLSVLIQCVC